VAQLAERWAQTTPKSEGSEQVYQSPLGAAFLPAKSKLSTLVIGPAAQISDVIKLAGTTPPLRLELEKLLQATDDTRLATLLITPSIALRSGSEIFTGELQNLLEPAREFIGPRSRGVDFSAHLDGQSLFLELRLLNPLGMLPMVAATEAKQRLEKLPQSVERLTAGLKPQPYGSLVLVRFPQMAKAVERYSRVGHEQDQAVLRCYLPAVAAHNLALAAELALAESTGTASTDPSGALAAASDSVPAVAPVAERLKRKTSLNFARDTLEKALILLADDVGVKMEILGPDLQLEGITKNQSFGLDEHDKPADEILRNIMLKANPDGKLVYVIKPKAPGEADMLFVTTRAAVAKRGDQLPPELDKAK
jgi:hypothetical protein